MKTLGTIDTISDMAKTLEQKQQEITTSEVGNLWIKLTARYDVIENMKIMRNFVQDSDLKSHLNKTINSLENQAVNLEQLMKDYALPLPPRPPAHSVTTQNVESYTDEYIFKRVYDNIQSFLPVHMVAFQQSFTPRLRKQFRNFLEKEMDFFDDYLNLGKQKGWLDQPPEFRP